MFQQNFDDRFGIAHKIVGVEFQLVELRILANKVFHGILEAGDDGFQFLPSGRFFDVENHFVIDSQFPGDRQGIGR